MSVSPFVTVHSISTNGGGVCAPEIRLILSLTISPPEGRSTPLVYQFLHVCLPPFPCCPWCPNGAQPYKNTLLGALTRYFGGELRKCPFHAGLRGGLPMRSPAAFCRVISVSGNKIFFFPAFIAVSILQSSLINIL